MTDAPAHPLTCRLCGGALDILFVDLGLSPLANAFLTEDQLAHAETRYPLRAYVCAVCFLVQLPPHATPETIFHDYLYFSSVSEEWLAHAKRFANDAAARFNLGPHSQVVEIASNDGYLLQYFHAKGIPVLGIEPAATVAEAARAKGVPTREIFLNAQSAQALRQTGTQADLLVANNVLAHVPDLHSFVAGLQTLLKPNGVLALEFPHVLALVRQNAFDTIYHEHFSYLSLHTVDRLLAAHALAAFDAEALTTHGGSYRLYVRHQGAAAGEETETLRRLRQEEQNAGLATLGFYQPFQKAAEKIKADLLEFLRQVRRAGKKVAGYGAPAKGNTLLNYCGIGTDCLAYTVDRGAQKQGRYLPGSHLPIAPPERLSVEHPDYVLILPWNLKAEIVRQQAQIRDWGGQFVTAIPSLEMF